jgi:hypothetical protein
LDGVFVEQRDGPPRFEQLPELRSADIAELVTVIRIRVLPLLARRRVIEDASELTLLPTDLAEREREPLRLARDPGATITGLMRYRHGLHIARRHHRQARRCRRTAGRSCSTAA